MDANGTIQWPDLANVNLITAQTKPIPMKLSFVYKRNDEGTNEERNSRSSIQGNRMKKGINYDEYCTRAPMVDRCGTRMVVAHAVEFKWIIEHFDI